MLKNVILILYFTKECQRVMAVFPIIHRSNINKFYDFSAINFIESVIAQRSRGDIVSVVIAMIFSNTSHLVLNEKFPL